MISYYGSEVGTKVFDETKDAIKKSHEKTKDKKKIDLLLFTPIFFMQTITILHLYFFNKYFQFFNMNGVIYIAIVSTVVVILGASAIFFVESEAEDTQIHTWLDAFWWASATATTVGYGDIVPVTETGRIIGIAMMYVGIGIIGAFISTVGATLIGSRMNKTGIADDTKSLLISKIEGLEKLEKKEIEIIKNMIDTLHNDIAKKQN